MVHRSSAWASLGTCEKCSLSGPTPDPWILLRSKVICMHMKFQDAALWKPIIAHSVEEEIEASRNLRNWDVHLARAVKPGHLPLKPCSWWLALSVFEPQPAYISWWNNDASGFWCHCMKCEIIIQNSSLRDLPTATGQLGLFSVKMLITSTWQHSETSPP